MSVSSVAAIAMNVPLEVAGLVLAAEPLDRALGGERLSSGTAVGRDEHDAAVAGEQALDLLQADLAAADDEAAPTGQLQAGDVERRLEHPLHARLIADPAPELADALLALYAAAGMTSHGTTAIPYPGGWDGRWECGTLAPVPPSPGAPMRNLRMLLAREPAASGRSSLILPVLSWTSSRSTRPAIAAVVVATPRRLRLACSSRRSPRATAAVTAPSASRPSRNAVRASGSAPPRSAAQRSDSRPCSSRADAVAARSSAGSYGSQRAERSRVGWDASWRVGEVLGEPHRRGRRGDAVLVDPGDLRARPAGDQLAMVAVAAPDRQRPLGERVASAIASSSLARLLHREHGAGHGLAQQLGVGRHVAEHHRGVERARDRRAARRGPPHMRVAPAASAAATSASTRSRAAMLGSGPTSVSGRLGSPTRSLRAAVVELGGQRRLRAAAPRSHGPSRGVAAAGAGEGGPERRRLTTRSSGAPSSTSIVPFGATADRA